MSTRVWLNLSRAPAPEPARPEPEPAPLPGTYKAATETDAPAEECGPSRARDVQDCEEATRITRDLLRPPSLPRDTAREDDFLDLHGCAIIDMHDLFVERMQTLGIALEPDIARFTKIVLSCMRFEDGTPVTTESEESDGYTTDEYNPLFDDSPFA